MTAIRIVCVVAIVALAAGSRPGADGYYVLDLADSTPLLTYGGAEAINDGGTIVGWSTTLGWIWKDGQIAFLPSIGGPYSTAFDVNEQDQVVGDSWVSDGGPFHPVLWDGGVASDLGTLGGTFGVAYAISDAEPPHVVGASQIPGGNFHGFLWRDGVMADLYPPLDFLFSVAYDVNDSGDAVGTCGHFVQHACAWFAGAPVSLGALGSGDIAGASSINNAGDIVGWSNVTAGGMLHGFIRRDGVMTDLGIGDSLLDEVRPESINEAGQVVGWHYVAAEGRYRSFLWDDGSLTYLATLGGDFSVANDINAEGDIVGQSSTTATHHPYLATLRPISPEARIQALADLIASYGLPAGTENSLEAKVYGALAALQAPNASRREDAPNHLQAFVNAVEALRGTRLTDAQADALTSLALGILASL